MPIWQWLVVLWLCLWALQSAGVWMQMRAYAQLTNALLHEFADGYIGTGTSPRRLGRGSVAIIVVSADMVVRRVVVMSGVTFLARFKPLNELENMSTSTMLETVKDGKYPSSLRPAMEKAQEQIMRAAARKEAAQSNDHDGMFVPHAVT